MPEQATLKRARQDKRAGKAPSTQAGEFVREEIHHVREGKHGARSTKQAIAIGLSKARRAGVKLPRPPASAKASTKRSAAAATRAARRKTARPSARRSRASRLALKREGRSVVSRKALARQARASARRRSPAAPQRRGTPRRANEGPASPARRRGEGGANPPAFRFRLKAEATRSPHDPQAQVGANTGSTPESRIHEPGSGGNLGTFGTRAAAEQHERAVQFFKRRG